MRFVIFVIDGDGNTAAPNEMVEIDKFNDQLIASNQLVVAVGIADPTRSKLIDNRNGKGEQRTASLFDSANYYSGFWLIHAASESEALEIAMDGSRACNRRVELRPLLGD